MLQRLAIAVLSAILPPLGLYLWQGASRAMLGVTALWLVGFAIFFFLFAGPGFLLVGGAGFVAFLLVLFTSRRARR